MYKQAPVLVLIVLITLLLLPGCEPKKKTDKDEAVPVEVTATIKRDLPRILSYSGDVKGEVEVRVFATVPDRIRRLYVDVGDRVRKGKLIALIEHTRLRLAVSQAKASLAAVRAQLAAAKVGVAGGRVQFTSARREYRRILRLKRSGAVGEQQVDLSKARLDGASTQVRAALEQMNALRAQIAALKAAVGQASSAKRNALVRAPISGIVGRRWVNEGDRALPQIPIVTLVKMDRVKVTIALTEKDLGRVRLGMEVRVKVEAYKRRFKGTVSRIAPMLDPATRTAPLEILVANPKHLLKPGMFCKVAIHLGVKRGAVLMPIGALLNNSFGYSSAKHRSDLQVLVLNSKDKVEFRKVTIGAETGSLVEVTSGLAPGEKVVVSGHNLYKKGLPVRVVRTRKI